MPVNNIKPNSSPMSLSEAVVTSKYYLYIFDPSNSPQIRISFDPENPSIMNKLNEMKVEEFKTPISSKWLKAREGLLVIARIAFGAWVLVPIVAPLGVLYNGTRLVIQIVLYAKERCIENNPDRLQEKAQLIHSLFFSTCTDAILFLPGILGSFLLANACNLLSIGPQTVAQRVFSLAAGLFISFHSVVNGVSVAAYVGLTNNYSVNTMTAAPLTLRKQYGIVGSDGEVLPYRGEDWIEAEDERLFEIRKSSYLEIQICKRECEAMVGSLPEFSEVMSQDTMEEKIAEKLRSLPKNELLEAKLKDFQRLVKRYQFFDSVNKMRVGSLFDTDEIRLLKKERERTDMMVFRLTEFRDVIRDSLD